MQNIIEIYHVKQWCYQNGYKPKALFGVDREEHHHIKSLINKRLNRYLQNCFYSFMTY